MLAWFANSLRLARAKQRHKTVRFKVGNLRAFYAALEDKGIGYVVLRWTDDVPLDRQDANSLAHDIDHLVARDTIDRIKRIASRYPGRAKCDFYGMTGQRGTAYRGMPYLPPALAEEVLQSAAIRAHPFQTPAAQQMFLAFAYHLTYHKGVECGIDTGLDGVVAQADPARDYGAELQRLATLAGLDLPQPVTLLGLHKLLATHLWNMPLDLMVRWPHQHGVIKALTKLERATLAPLADKCGDLNIFVLRSDCEGTENEALARSMITQRFTILDDRPLSDDDTARLMRLTRGGNWFEKNREAPITPTHIFVCQQSATPGPLPHGMSAEKCAARYPHLDHTDVLIKRDIRDAVNAASGGPANRIVIHATDNAIEAAEVLAALKSGAALAYLDGLRTSPPD